jgi:heme-degrading monooxygenase HmoA
MMIEHTVTFSLKHSADSDAERTFLAAANELASIPGVQDFVIRRQVSAKHPHTFGITMRFASQADYDAYNAHPAHVAFVEEYWLKEVEAFQEADFVPLQIEQDQNAANDV